MPRITKDYPVTVAPALFEAWKKYRRKGDPDAIAKIAGKCKTVISRALKYGFVKDKAVVTVITKFYNDRLAEEKNEGKALLEK